MGGYLEHCVGDYYIWSGTWSWGDILFRLEGEGEDDHLSATPGSGVSGEPGAWVYIYGGPGDDWIYGKTYGADSLRGENGDDYIYGYGGDDHLYGGNGRDFLDGGSGDDYIYGEYSGVGYGYCSGDPGCYSDCIWGGPGVDKLYGGRGYDKINGGDANDYLYGNFGGRPEYGQDCNKLVGGNGTSDAPHVSTLAPTPPLVACPARATVRGTVQVVESKERRKNMRTLLAFLTTLALVSCSNDTPDAPLTPVASTVEEDTGFDCVPRDGARLTSSDGSVAEDDEDVLFVDVECAVTGVVPGTMLVLEIVRRDGSKRVSLREYDGTGRVVWEDKQLNVGANTLIVFGEVGHDRFEETTWRVSVADLAP
jgi:hypothetical protein